MLKANMNRVYIVHTTRPRCRLRQPVASMTLLVTTLAGICYGNLTRIQHEPASTPNTLLRFQYMLGRNTRHSGTKYLQRRNAPVVVTRILEGLAQSNKGEFGVRVQHDPEACLVPGLSAALTLAAARAAAPLAAAVTRRRRPRPRLLPQLWARS